MNACVVDTGWMGGQISKKDSWDGLMDKKLLIG